MAGRQRERGTGGKGRSGGSGQGSNQRGMREPRDVHRMGEKADRASDVEREVRRARVPLDEPAPGPTTENLRRPGPKGRQPLPASQASREDVTRPRGRKK